MNNEFMKYNYIKILIVFMIVINCIGLFFPILRQDDATLYANIAKHIVLTNDWINLYSSNKDWLDKPHFPFWITALTFKCFGVNSFSYILPGFIFNLVGAFYTYKLGRLLYNKNVGLISALILLSSIHILISSIDVRAEAYLMGEIVPACYYLYKYDNEIKLKFLILASFFTALALMTKGLFVLVTIISGLLIKWIYKKQSKKLVSPKYIIFYLLTLIMISPEIISLYLQFDAHPEKIIFGHNNVSGIKWFFWGSQFGRFFNDGLITRNNPIPYHYLFYFHTFIWAFLPWSIIFIATIFQVKRIRYSKFKISAIYLIGSFIPTFIIFSLTSFQLDYYTNILMPFSAIFCANGLCELVNNKNNKLIFSIQNWFIIFLLFLNLLLCFIMLKNFNQKILIIFNFLLIFLIIKFKSFENLKKVLIYSTITIGITFSSLITIYGKVFTNYDIGYKIAKITNNSYKTPVVTYLFNSNTLEFYMNNPHSQIKDLNNLKNFKKEYFLVIPSNKFNSIKLSFPQLVIKSILPVNGITIDKFIANIFDKDKLNKNLTYYVILKVANKN